MGDPDGQRSFILLRLKNKIVFSYFTIHNN